MGELGPLGCYIPAKVAEDMPFSTEPPLLAEEPRGRGRVSRRNGCGSVVNYGLLPTRKRTDLSFVGVGVGWGEEQRGVEGPSSQASPTKR